MIGSFPPDQQWTRLMFKGYFNELMHIKRLVRFLKKRKQILFQKVHQLNVKSASEIGRVNESSRRKNLSRAHNRERPIFSVLAAAVGTNKPASVFFIQFQSITRRGRHGRD
jgi:hypothetical protein